jgi:predicted nucleic acid-binding protein
VKKVTIAENLFNSALGKGELEALELAKQENVLLIVDDRKARNLAQLLEIKYQTTITTIFEILLAKKIDLSEYKTNLKKYAEDSWISADIIQEYLDRGEKFG